MRTSLKMRPPLWWRVFGVLQLVLAAVALLGLAWLVVLIVLGLLQLPEVNTPRLGPFPYPLLMLVGGLLLGAGLAALARVLARTGARRRGERIRRTLMEAVEGVAIQRIIGPVRAVLERHRATREALARATAPSLQPAGGRARSRALDE